MKMKVGDYELRIVKDGFEETSLNIPEGGTYYVVQLEKEGQMDVATHLEAEILSRFVRIENMLKGLKKNESKDN